MLVLTRRTNQSIMIGDYINGDSYLSWHVNIRQAERAG